MHNPVFKMESIIPIVLLICTLTSVIGCNKGFDHGHGWGEPHPVIILPKPTLFPKLKAAFIDGKLSVDYHKIVSPSLKPLPYKKGIGWIGKGWVPHHHGWGHHGIHGINNIHGFNHYDYPIGVGKSGYIGVSYGKGIGIGKGLGFGKGIGIGYGKEVGLLGPVGYGHGGHGHLGGHGPIGGHGHLGGGHHLGGHLGGGHHLGGHLGEHGHHIGPHHIPVTPIAPHAAKLPIPHGPHGHIGHTVSHNAVTVVEKGLPHVGVPHGPIGNDLYGK